jgi:hypothetical protein
MLQWQWQRQRQPQLGQAKELEAGQVLPLPLWGQRLQVPSLTAACTASPGHRKP